MGFLVFLESEVRNTLFGNVFSEYPNDVSLYVRADVEQIGCNLLDCVAMRQELCLPDRCLAASFARKSIHGGFADPTFDGFISVQHEKCERQPFAVMSDNFVTYQRHRTPLISTPLSSDCTARRKFQSFVGNRSTHEPRFWEGAQIILRGRCRCATSPRACGRGTRPGGRSSDPVGEDQSWGEQSRSPALIAVPGILP